MATDRYVATGMWRPVGGDWRESKVLRQRAVGLVAVLECVVNVSEGRDEAIIAELGAVCGADLLDVHSDQWHNRSVLTLVGEEAPRLLASAAVSALDISRHDGVHPRIGVVDVVPFVPLAGTTLEEAISARRRFCEWAAATLALPCFVYGPERDLPDVRRRAFGELAPDFGPRTPHPTAGACAVGARTVLVAYNIWLEGADVALARSIALQIRTNEVRALGLDVGGSAQVSMNLVDPLHVGPGQAFDRVAAILGNGPAGIARSELVGLVPRQVLEAIPPSRWDELDLGDDRSIEGRLEIRSGRSG